MRVCAIYGKVDSVYRAGIVKSFFQYKGRGWGSDLSGDCVAVLCASALLRDSIILHRVSFSREKIAYGGCGVGFGSFHRKRAAKMHKKSPLFLYKLHTFQIAQK